MEHDQEIVIKTTGLSKYYGEVRAVDGLDLCVRRGEIYGFLGRNGAGKTTTIRLLLGLIRPTGGQVMMLDNRIRPGRQAVFARIGYLVETATSYPNLTVHENLDIQRRLTGAPRKAVAEAIELLRLGEYADRRAGRLSLGNKQRLALARVLLHHPDVLLLDEPANGLDPAGIVEVRGLLRRLADERGVTVFLSSHILAEVAHLADRIGIMHAGRLVEELGQDRLRAQGRACLEVVVSNPDRAVALLAERLGITQVERTTEGGLRIFEGLDRAAAIARVLACDGLDLTRLCLVEENLEAHFLRLTGDGT
ncbi:MAG: ABC transporter ATP-binding protein [Candidatus Aminicenantales bacterium]